tara:strand:+ start:76 stop:360 length:285 start_codon:yes stop_codon:yes gene_type:complete
MSLQENRPIIKDLSLCDELHHQFYEVISIDDGILVWEYSDEEIIAEANYVKEKYEDQTWSCGLALAGYEGKEEQKIARKEYNQIKRFLKKWEVV